MSGVFRRRSDIWLLRRRVFVPTVTAGGGAVEATLDATLGSLTSDLVSAIAVDASLNASLGGITISSTATVAVSASLDASLGPLTISASADTLAVIATASNTLGALTISSTATVAVSAALTGTFGDLTLSGQAAVAVSAALDASLGPLTISGVGVVSGGAAEGTLSESLDGLTISGAATVAVSASLNTSLDGLSISAEALNPMTASLDSTLGSLVISSSLDNGDAPVVIPDPTSSSTGGGGPAYFRSKAYRKDLRRTILKAAGLLKEAPSVRAKKRKAKKISEKVLEEIKSFDLRIEDLQNVPVDVPEELYPLVEVQTDLLRLMVDLRQAKEVGITRANELQRLFEEYQREARKLQREEEDMLIMMIVDAAS